MLQAGLAVIVAALSLSPASGTAVYLPLDGSGSVGAIAWSRGHGARLLAPGPYEGSYIMRVSPGTTTAAALADGALLIAVPELLCGAAVRQKKAQS